MVFRRGHFLMTVLHVLQLQSSVIFGPHLVSNQENILKVEIFQHFRLSYPAI